MILRLKLFHNINVIIDQEIENVLKFPGGCIVREEDKAKKCLI